MSIAARVAWAQLLVMGGTADAVVVPPGEVDLSISPHVEFTGHNRGSLIRGGSRGTALTGHNRKAGISGVERGTGFSGRSRRTT